MNRILLVGSDRFPTTIFNKLLKSDKFIISGLITSSSQPTQIKNDKNTQIYTPKVLSVDQKLILSETNPDLILVCNYGQFLNTEILSYPKYGCLNIHASLLPKLRGACPIEMAILKGFSKTGITIQEMVEKMDEGDIIFQEEIAVLPNETGKSLYTKLQDLSTKIIEKVLVDWTNSKITPEKQDHKKATYCYRKDISKKAAKINWGEDADLIERKIRAFNPRPTAWSFLVNDDKQKRIKIFAAEKSSENLNLTPGQVKTEDQLHVQAGKRSIILKEVQLEGKKRMSGEEFLRGIRNNFKFA